MYLVLSSKEGGNLEERYPQTQEEILPPTSFRSVMPELSLLRALQQAVILNLLLLIIFESTMTSIDKIDAARFSSSMLPVEDLYFGDDGHTVPTATGWQERWENLYLSYLHYYKGQVVPMNGSEWRFLRYDAYNRFKALKIDEIRSIVCDFVSIKMIGEYPLVHDAALSNEKLSYLFYCFYAPYTTFVNTEGAPSIKIDQDYIGIIFLHRSNAEEIVTRKICGLLRTYEIMASMEVSVPKSEDEDRNNKLGGVYQRLDPRCCRILLREGKRLVSKILKDFPLIDEVLFADLGSGMNLMPLYASSMFAWKALGIEVVQNRIHLAAEGHLHLMDHECDWFKKLRVGMYHKNLAKESDNWAGIVCYLCWDLV